MILTSKTTALALASIGLALSAPASQAFFGGATEFTQLLNNAELVALAGQSGIQIDNQLVQISHQIEQIGNQLRIYENMLQNTRGLPDAMWSDVQADLDELRAIAQQGEALALSMADIDQVLRDRFASYGEQMAEMLGGTEFSETYAQWSETNRDTIAGSLAAAHAAGRQFAGEDSTVSQLEVLSDSAIGQLQALQVGHQLAGQQIGQMQKLRALVSQQMVMTGTWYQSEQAARDLAQARRDTFFEVTGAYPITGGQDMEPRF